MEISVDITSGMDWGHGHANYAQMLWHHLWHIQVCSVHGVHRRCAAAGEQGTGDDPGVTDACPESWLF